MSSGVILLAAGASRRFNGRTPKQFVSFRGAPLYLHSLKEFLRMRTVAEIVVVVPRRFQETVRRQVAKVARNKPVRVVAGGAYRGESVRNGVRVLTDRAQVILIHDAARAMISKEVAARVEKAARAHGAALAAWPLSDTLKEVGRSGFVRRTVSRKKFWLAQTPQGFTRKLAERCLMSPSPSATDDVQLAENKGCRVAIVPGSPLNIKVTYPHDLKICEVIRKR